MKKNKYKHIQVSILLSLRLYSLDTKLKNICCIKETLKIDKNPRNFSKNFIILGNDIKFLELLKFLNE